MINKTALIITYYNAPNYGAFLQAYAMQEFLKSKGINAFICNHSANKPNLLTFLLDKRIESKVIEYRKEMQKIIDKVQMYLNISNNKTMIYDIAIIGSDEVWNIKNLTAVHLPLFFKNYKRAKKTISYAACAGNCKAKHLKLIPYTANMRKLSAISVRDSGTEKAINEFGCKSIVQTLDPTFLYDFNSQLPLRSIAEDYLLVYTYGLGSDVIETIILYAKEERLKIIAVGSKCEWADQNLLPTPFEWLSLIKHSLCVITSTFHGCVFSIIFNKRFVSVENQSNKVKSLLEELDLSSRMIKNICDLKNLLNTEIDYTYNNQIIDAKKMKSIDFIINNL